MKKNAKHHDSFEAQTKTFNKLLKGAKMAKASSGILIVLSIVLAIASRDNVMNVMLLLMGVLAIVFFIDKFLSIKNIVQKSYTQTTLLSSITKLKVYMANRKKYEMYFIAFWILTLIPSAAKHFESNVEGVIAILFYIFVVFIFGNLAYKKSNQQIADLEQTIEAEMRLLNK